MQLNNAPQHAKTAPDENMVRHMVLNSLRSYRQKFSSEYGELIIACDNTNLWRKQFFPYYKANRKLDQQESDLDWDEIFRILNKIRSELKEFFPYKVIDIERAEADDVIGTLVSHFGIEGPLAVGEKILIISGDKDFIQLQKYSNVRQYDPVKKKSFMDHDDPEKFLKEHIIRGDKGDGIPNILSPDNCIVIKERQKSITKGRLESFMLNDPSEYDTITQSRFARNKTLIDLSQTPSDIREKVIESFNQPVKDRSKLLDYFIKNKLRNLMESISEF